MPITLIDVLDTAIKIGLGSVITAVSGYLVLKRTHNFEQNKDQINRYYLSREERKTKYIEFISQSQTLTQKYLDISCNCQSEDYMNYIKAFSEVQIISDDPMRMAAFKVYTAVNEFIVYESSHDFALSLKMRNNVNDAVGIFFAAAKTDVNKDFNSNAEPKSSLFGILFNKINNITKRSTGQP